MVVVREIRPEDVEAARLIWNEVVASGDAFPQVEGLSSEEAPGFFGSQSRTAVAEVDGDVVGLYILHPNNVGRCAVVSNASYAVASGCRGKGIGRALVSDSVVWAGRLGFTGLQFNAVVEGNASAHHLYRELGFDHIGVIPRGFKDADGRLVDIHIYHHPANAADDGPVLDVADVVALERRIESEGTPLYELMKKAGNAVADAAEERMRKVGTGGLVTVLCGAGNNGGDGWVAAKHLLEAGFNVILATPVEPSEIRAQPAAQAAADLLSRKRTNLDVLVRPDLDQVREALGFSGVAIDAMLGTGFSHDEVREPLASWIAAMNDERGSGSGLQVVSVDVPSGLNAQTGFAASPTVRADETVTMLAYKPGLLCASAVPYVGLITLAPL